MRKVEVNCRNSLNILCFALLNIKQGVGWPVHKIHPSHILWILQTRRHQKISCMCLLVFESCQGSQIQWWSLATQTANSQCSLEEELGQLCKTLTDSHCLMKAQKWAKAGKFQHCHTERNRKLVLCSWKCQRNAVTLQNGLIHAKCKNVWHAQDWTKRLGGNSTPGAVRAGHCVAAVQCCHWWEKCPWCCRGSGARGDQVLPRESSEGTCHRLLRGSSLMLLGQWEQQARRRRRRRRPSRASSSSDDCCHGNSSYVGEKERGTSCGWVIGFFFIFSRTAQTQHCIAGL